MYLRALCATAALALVSCSTVQSSLPSFAPYRIEIQQGNFVSQEMVSQLKPGMSKDQVRFVLGSPLIIDSFHTDRWDYVFRRQRNISSQLEQRKVTVFFEDGKLKRVEGDIAPAASADAAPIKLPETRVNLPQAPDQAAAAGSKPPPVATEGLPAAAAAVPQANAPK